MHSWRRTLYIMFFAQMMSAVGFSSIFPFLPLYVESLGSTFQLSVELLAGLVYSGHAISMTLVSPVWGALADRYGRKLMVERAMFGGAVLLLPMAFVSSAEQLVFLRIIQGLVTGTVSAANALVASQVPRDQIGYAMGLLQVGHGLGVALGPLIGGAVADLYGYGTTFYVTSVLLLLAGILVFIGVKESRFSDIASMRRRVSIVDEWRQIVATSGVVGTYSVRFVSELGRMMILPILPLFIQSLLTDSSRVNTFTGLVIGVTAITSTASAAYLGRLGDRVGHRHIVLASAIGVALLYAPHSLASAGWHLLVLQALVGIGLGGIVPSLSSLLAGYIEPGDEGAAYGLDNSINAGSRAFAPMIGAAVAMTFGLPATFIATALLFILAAMVAGSYLPQSPVTAKPGPRRSSGHT